MKNLFDIQIMKPNNQLPEILLVEDNDDDAEIVLSILEKNKINATVYRVNSGEDALDYLFQKGKFENARNKKNPRIVLLDINLPRLNGIDVLKSMRAHPGMEHTPVFVFTSSTSDYDAFESYRLGVTAYINKQTSFEKFEQGLLGIDLFLKVYKVLILEDNQSDAELVYDELKNSNLECTWTVVANKKEYVKALEKFNPDIIFCDYDLPPRFDAIQAVQILKKTSLKIPFVLISGKLSEDLASACLANGMDDYILKGMTNRVPVVMINSLRKKKAEIEKSRMFEYLVLQNAEREKRAAELVIANKELVYQYEEKEKRTAELLIANQELLFQREQKAKRAAELIVANEELVFQNKEKEKRAAELLIANQELL